MLFRPDQQDLSLIGYYTGRVLTGVGAAMLLPALLAAVLGETNDFYAFLLAASLTVTVGELSARRFRIRAVLGTGQGLATVALAWLLAPVFAALPLVLSGHYATYLDGYFESMSGFATIGLTLANDLDHMSRSVNLWRHLMQFLGGQGIIVVVLTLLASGGAIGTLYTGEGREEKILPNVVRTARFIWRVALMYAFLGTTLLFAALIADHLPPLAALYHAVALFMAAFDTGGFSVQSSSVAFYRSWLVEIVLLVIMLAGAFSFALHYQLWYGRKREILRNLETRTMAFTLLALSAVIFVGLARAGVTSSPLPLFRQGFFGVVSAHTTTGLAIAPGRLLLSDWGALAPAMLVGGMALGGMAGSTAGGIKAIRVGLLLKGLRWDLRRLLLPENAVVIETYHSSSRRVLRSNQVQAAVILLLLWLMLYLVGAMLGLYYGYDLEQSIFESTAAASSGGLSVGVVRPDMETPLKVAYILQMVTGRLEFIAIFALVGYVVSMFRGRV